MEEKTYIFEGKTTNDAIEKGLKELKVSKNMVDIKVLEQDDKKSFFDILAPRVVKIEMKLKNNKSVESELTVEELTNCKNETEIFLEKFIKNLNMNLEYKIKEENNSIFIEINGNDSGVLIGYRGEVLNSLQTIISNVANKNQKGKVRVILNVGGYREKREKDLQILATKIASSVIKTNKKITLEPMSAYERKIIHTKLQDNDRIKTYSIGEEPYRKVVIDLK